MKYGPDVVAYLREMDLAESAWAAIEVVLQNDAAGGHPSGVSNAIPQPSVKASLSRHGSWGAGRDPHVRKAGR